MLAHELMTTDVVKVGPEATRQQIACTLIDHGISALPVVDSSGVPLGMVSEGDLIGRDEPERKQRRDWWLALVAEGETLNEEYIAILGAKDEPTARDLMSTPLIVAQEDTEASEIARLLVTYRIKRVPVLREGKIVGIVSRADLLRVIAPPCNVIVGFGRSAIAASTIEPSHGSAGEPSAQRWNLCRRFSTSGP